MISQYWIDQIPAKPLSILIKDEAGVDKDLSSYTSITARLVGSNNEEIDLTGSTLNTSNKAIGKIIFSWPTDRSLFQYKGDYVFQLELAAEGQRDFTSTHTLRVRDLGRVNKNVYNR
jgi:hypothetical protein